MEKHNYLVIYLNDFKLQWFPCKTKQDAFDYIERLLTRDDYMKKDAIMVVKGDIVPIEINETKSFKVSDTNN
tara:strand:- start:58 stop:273 length:216 start_codon:yes stop_codon:yes gene_type:complete